MKFVFQIGKEARLAVNISMLDFGSSISKRLLCGFLFFIVS